MVGDEAPKIGATIDGDATTERDGDTGIDPDGDITIDVVEDGAAEAEVRASASLSRLASTRYEGNPTSSHDACAACRAPREPRCRPAGSSPPRIVARLAEIDVTVTTTDGQQLEFNPAAARMAAAWLEAQGQLANQPTSKGV